MRSSIKKILFIAVALITLLSACVPAQPTQSASDIANQVATAVALTMAAQNSIETHVAETVGPMATNTMLPTQTEVVLIPPTETPTAVILPTATKASSGGGGGGGTTVKPDYACNPFPRKPRDNTIFKPNDEFDISWTIVNTGKKTMQAGIDVRYNSGTKLTSSTFAELPELKPGDQYVVVFDAVAPEKEGTYIMTFIVEGGLCYPYTAIIVEKP
jgi:hypothetical protein